MPFPYSSELIQIMSARSGAAPVLLLDVVAIDGTSYHWASKEIDVAPVYPETLPGTPPAAWLAGLANPPANYDTHYFPWLLSVSGFNQNRAQQAVTASVMVQNISGDSLKRDLMGMLTARTFEGAIYCFREWNLLSQEAEFEQHGHLTVVRPVSASAPLARIFCSTRMTMMDSHIPTPRRASGGSAVLNVDRRR